MCANEVKFKTYDLSIAHAQHMDDSKKEDKAKEAKISDGKFPRIDPFYITWFWPVY